MSYDSNNNLSEIKRIREVTDMMVTSHAFLRERYYRLSLLSDIFLFSCTLILCVISFADQSLLVRFLGTNFIIYVGYFAIVTFIYSFFSRSLDWKVKAEKHTFAFEKYSDLKFGCNDIIEKAEKGENIDINKFLEKYYTITPTITSIPERLFLKCKKHHKLKVAISKHLDQNPGTSILFFKLKLWFSGNFKRNSKQN